MNTASRTIGVLASTVALVLAPAGLLGQTSAPSLNLEDPELFPPEFFPSLSDLSEQELLLAGLQSLYPEKIRTSLPDPAIPAPTPPILREIDPTGVYIRVKHLQSALPAIRENLAKPLVVLDLRFLTADLDSTLALGSYLTRNANLRLTTVGEYPVPESAADPRLLKIASEGLRAPGQTVFTLSNHETRGPIEALLAQLHDTGEIISVGAASPGATAVFKPFPGLDSYFLIHGEIRPADGRSLVESGFVPRVLTTAGAAEDRLGYESLREGVSLDDLIETRISKPRFDEARLLRERSETPRPENADGEPDAEEEIEVPPDPILRRALNIVKALQALGEIET